MKRFIIVLIISFAPYSLFSDPGSWKGESGNGKICNDCRGKNASVINGFQGGAYLLVRFFQIVISPQDGPNCRHTPVCSVYARRAVEKHGAFKGSILAGDRLLRCNPFYYLDRDPVPDEVLGE